MSWRGRGWRLGLGVLLALALTARAQTAGAPGLPDVSAQLCALPDDLLDVTIAGQYRGTRFVRRGPDGRLYLDAGSLRPAEAGYADGHANCDGVEYLRLSPDLRFELDSARQTLSVAPALSRLPTGELDFGGVLNQSGESLPISTAYAADFGVRAGYTFGGSLSGQGYLGASVFGDRWGAQASVLADLNGGTFSLTPRARASYDLAPQWTVGLGYNVAPLSDDASGPSTDELRLEVGGSFGFTRVLPTLVIQLPLEADLRVVIGGRTVREVHASPGVLTLRNLPLPGSVGQVEVYVRDATGESVQRYAYAFNPASLPPGAFTVRGGVAYGSLGLGGDASTTFGISEHLIGSASARWRSDGYRAALGLTGLWDRSAMSALLLVSGPGEAGPQVTASGVYSLALDPLYLRFSVGEQLWPLLAPSVGASLGYRTDRLAVQADAGYAFASQRLDLGLSGGYALSDAQVLTASVGLSGGSLRFGLGLRAVFSDSLLADASLSGPSPGGVFGVSPQLNVRYTPTPSQLITALASANELAASYRLTAPVALDARLSTRGLSAGVRGAVTFVNGQALLSTRASSAGLLIRTGIPGLPLRVNGSLAVTTDAAGNAFISTLTGGSEASVSVSLDDLPITISAGKLETNVLVPTGGVAELNWQDNFTVSRWIRFLFADGNPAAYGSVLLGGLRFDTDDQGYALVPVRLAGVTGELRADGGGQACRVTVPADRETATCAP